MKKSYLEPAIEDFNAQSSNIKVSYSFMVPDDYYVKVLTLLSSEMPTLMSSASTDRQVTSTYRWAAADLTPFIEKIMLTFPSTVPACKH